MLDKEILLEVRRSTLTLSEDDDIVYILYTDYTYRCSHWNKNDASEWKILDGHFWVRHEGSDDWTNCSNEVGDDILVDLLQAEMYLRELVER